MRQLIYKKKRLALAYGLRGSISWTVKFCEIRDDVPFHTPVVPLGTREQVFVEWMVEICFEDHSDDDSLDFFPLFSEDQSLWGLWYNTPKKVQIESNGYLFITFTQKYFYIEQILTSTHQRNSG